MVTAAGGGDIARVDGENNDYSGDFSTSCGLIYARDAAGVVEGIGPQVQTTGSDVKTMYQGDVIVGRMAMGVGTLNPACASRTANCSLRLIMSIRPGDIGSVEIDTAVGTTVSETYNPATHLAAANQLVLVQLTLVLMLLRSTQSDPEPLPLQ